MQWHTGQSKMQTAKVFVQCLLADQWPDSMLVPHVAQRVQGISPSTIYEAVRKLERQGLIERVTPWMPIEIRLVVHPDLTSPAEDRTADA
jgi:hypothetical protein